MNSCTNVFIMRNHSCKILVNPTTRNVDARLQAAVAVFKQRDIRADIHYTQAAGDAERFAIDFAKQGCSTIVALGGDGTVNEVANGIESAATHCAQKPTLGVIPAGSANDFARNLGIPLDPRKAAESIATGSSQAVDVLSIAYRRDGLPRHRICLSDAGLGLSSTVLNAVTTATRGMNGSAMYVWLSLSAFLRHKESHIRYEVDGQALNLGTSLLIASTGPSFIGFKLRKEARMNDGRFEVTILHSSRLLGRTVALAGLVSGLRVPKSRISYLTAQEIKMESDEPLQFNIDGDLMGETPATLRILPKSLRVHV